MTQQDRPEPWGIYVHCPWCRVHCPYCAFYVETERNPPWQSFVHAVLKEHDGYRPVWTGQPATLALGGGTPSRMPTEQIAEIVRHVELGPGAEVSAEANPEDLTPSWVDGALSAGITRLSVGVQTLIRQRAKLLGRAHTVDQAATALRTVASAGFESWSADLIFATPGQTLTDLSVELGALLDLDPPHVSIYGLTFEPGTPFERARARGRMRPVDDGLWREMYDLLVQRLGAAGLQRYEVSNFARPGHESRHNRLYWTGRPYMGLGPAAHGLAPDGTRWVNQADAAKYTAGNTTPTHERPTPLQAATDTLVSCLRGVDGVSLRDLRVHTGFIPEPAVVALLIRQGVLRRDGERVRLSHAGFPLCDAVTGRLVDALQPAAPR